MFGFSFGEIFLIIGATVALIGPKDVPIIAKTAGRLAGRAIGYVQVARGQFDTVFQQSQARQVHKELQETMAQLEAIRHEIRSVSLLNPGPLTQRLVDNISKPNASEESSENDGSINTHPHKESTQMSPNSKASGMLSEAATFSNIAKASNGSAQYETNNALGLLSVLPVSAEMAGMLPKRPDDMKGSDIMLEAVVEAEVAKSALKFFAQPENQIKVE